MQHNPQNSGLIAPDQVPCAYLSILTCNFTFKSKTTLAGIPQGNTMAELKKTSLTTLIIQPEKSQRIAATRQHQDGSAVQSKRLHRKSKIVTLKVPPDELRKILGVPQIYGLALELQGKRLEHLTHTALHSVLGSRKRFSGIQFLEKPESPTVLDISPGVWNSRYFQARLESNLAVFHV